MSLCIIIRFYSVWSNMMKSRSFVLLNNFVQWDQTCWNDFLLHCYMILFNEIRHAEMTFFLHCYMILFNEIKHAEMTFYCTVIRFYLMRSNMLNWHSFALLYDFIEWDQMCWNYILLHISFSILDPIQMEPFLRLTTDTESWASKSWILAVVKWSLTTYGELTPLLDACSQMHL